MYGYQFVGYSRYGQPIVADPLNLPEPAPPAIWFSAYGGSSGWNQPQWEVPEYNPYWGEWQYDTDKPSWYGGYGYGGYGGYTGYPGVYGG
jgi:hypothetical protein